MAKIKVGYGDGRMPKALATAIVEGQSFPFDATLTHKAKQSLVVPSSGISSTIPPGEVVKVKIRSLEQAWLMVTDLATLAQTYNSQAEDFAVIEVPDMAEKSKTSKAAKASSGGE